MVSGVGGEVEAAAGVLRWGRGMGMVQGEWEVGGGGCEVCVYD